MHQGAIEASFFIILKGGVTVTMVDEMHRERHIASLAGGDFFGAVALLFDTPRTATVRASSSCTLLSIHGDKFYRFLDQAPRLRGRIEAAAKARSTNPWLPRAMTRRAEADAGKE